MLFGLRMYRVELQKTISTAISSLSNIALDGGHSSCCLFTTIRTTMTTAPLTTETTTASPSSAAASSQETQQRRRVCLFGLSGDPPTGDGGHVGIVKALVRYESNYFDEIRILPVYRHTYSDKRQRLLSFKQRMKMCEAAFLNISLLSSPPPSSSSSSSSSTTFSSTINKKPTEVTISDAEYRSWLRAADGKSEKERQKLSVGTASLLDYLYEVEPPSSTEFTLCLGTDTFLDLTSGKWKESTRVLDLIQGRILVFDRSNKSNTNNGNHDNDDHVDTTTTIPNNKSDQLYQRIDQIPGSKLLHVEHLSDVSSSQVRACTDLEQLQQMVVPSVLDYIREHRLYALYGGDENTAS